MKEFIVICCTCKLHKLIELYVLFNEFITIYYITYIQCIYLICVYVIFYNYEINYGEFVNIINNKPNISSRYTITPVKILILSRKRSNCVMQIELSEALLSGINSWTVV